MTISCFPFQAEEKELVTSHLSSLSEKLRSGDLRAGVMADVLVRAMVCHVLGYDVQFAHVTAIHLAQKGTILEKKMGQTI